MLALVFSATLSAVEVDPKLDRAVRDALPVCSDASIQYAAYPGQLPERFKGVLVRIESPSHACDGQIVGVVSPAGNVFVGSPWPIASAEGATIEEKIRNFTWRNMREHMTATVERKHNADGLFPVTITQVTANGKLPVYGSVDPAGRTFFFGQFRPANDLRTSRLKLFDRFVAASPSKGPADAQVTIVEFSDFQCPSCQRSSGFADSILAKHGDAVRYVRYDLPLNGHAWAFPAALAGRAIYRQKPDVFWEYKKQVYANQAELNPLAFWDWARGFAEDHEIDLAKYDADLASETIKDEILTAAGTALSNDIRATPSFLVNGTLVTAGADGKALEAYVDKLLKK